MSGNESRREAAKRIRVSAACLAEGRVHPRHRANGDELRFRDPKGIDPSYLMTYTKGLPHDEATGLVENAPDVARFVRAIDSGDPRDFRDTPLGPNRKDDPCDPIRWCSKKANDAEAPVRAWESQSAGLGFDLEGPDAQAVTMPPAPAVGSDELTAEMGEVYVQALLRDLPFTELDEESDARANTLIGHLDDLPWFKNRDCCRRSDEERGRMRHGLRGRTAFRGLTPGDDVGPYISQFLLAGNRGVNGNDVERWTGEGLITYGAIRVDQRVRFAKPFDDHMQRWDEWLDVQNGADLRGLEAYEESLGHRFITTPRDLATYVHYDALYEAYLNACLTLLGLGARLDPGLPFLEADCIDHQQGFAHFGGPHILSLVTEVATRALKAVRFQKFNVHRRARPEVLAARLARRDRLGVPELDRMAEDLEPILEAVRRHNGSVKGYDSVLLPMAFCEGSPMHASYGAGHATVAGACTTILKAFFDHGKPLPIASRDIDAPLDASLAYVARFDDSKPVAERSYLEAIPVADADGRATRLTVEGELNKLCSNISIGRDWAGVHFYTDYIESIRMGEEIAIGILEEQKLTYGENFSMTVPLFDGGSVRI